MWAQDYISAKPQWTDNPLGRKFQKKIFNFHIPSRSGHMCSNQSENTFYIEDIKLQGKGDTFIHHLQHGGERIVLRVKIINNN